MHVVELGTCAPAIPINSPQGLNPLSDRSLYRQSQASSLIRNSVTSSIVVSSYCATWSVRGHQLRLVECLQTSKQLSNNLVAVAIHHPVMSKAARACASPLRAETDNPGSRTVSSPLQRYRPRRSCSNRQHRRIGPPSRGTHIPCRRTSTAYASGYCSMAFSRNSVKSSSNGVFSMIGMRKVS
jgi:hypothetical protein